MGVSSTVVPDCHYCWRALIGQLQPFAELSGRLSVEQGIEIKFCIESYYGSVANSITLRLFDICHDVMSTYSPSCPPLFLMSS